MVRKINNINDIVWFDKNIPLNIKDLVVYNLPFALPQIFIELLKISNGGVIDYNFSYYNAFFEDTIETGLGGIYGINPPDSEDIVNEYNNPPEFFPKNLVAFGEIGNGNLVCFDYRSDPKTDNPPIVYWNHEADIGKDVSFIANNFEEFIQMLEEPEDDEEINKP